MTYVYINATFCLVDVIVKIVYVWYRPVGDKGVSIVSQKHFKNLTEQFEHKHLGLGVTPLIYHLEVISGSQLSGILYIPLCLIRF